MIAFPFLLIEPAVRAGISVPEDEDAVDKLNQVRETHPHWFVYAALQLGAPMPSPTAHWDNAEIIAKLSLEEIKVITVVDLLALGWQ